MAADLTRDENGAPVLLIDSPVKRIARHATRGPIGKLAFEGKGKRLWRQPGTLSNFASKLPGGRETFMELARWSPDERVKRMVEIWYSIGSSTRKNSVALDDVAQQAGIDPLEAAGLVTTAALRHGRIMSEYVAASSMADVVAKNAEIAKTPEGVADRKMFLEHTGILPTPKGISIQQSTMQQVNYQGPPDAPTFESSIIDVAEEVRREEDERK